MNFHRNKRTYLLILIGTAVSLFVILGLSHSTADDIHAQQPPLWKWHESDRVTLDCRASCQEIGLYPVRSGYYNKAKSPYYDEFFVCGIEKNSRGWRPGFNLEGEAACGVGTGGNAVRSRNKACLCSPEKSPNTWFSAKLISDCSATCSNFGGAVSGGVNNSSAKHYGASYDVCAVNAWGRGWRPGYNLEGTRDCTAGSGGKKSYHDRYKMCLCQKPLRFIVR